MNAQFDAFDIPRPDTDQNIRWFYGTPFPHNKIIADAFNISKKGRFTKPNEYDCARNHYAIIKTAYDLGWENVLVIEDDVLFLKDTDVCIHIYIIYRQTSTFCKAGDSQQTSVSTSI